MIIGMKPSRHRRAKDHKWLKACLARRGDPAWVLDQWKRLQGKGSPDWKRIAVARSARHLGLTVELSWPAFRIYVNRRDHAERVSTWVALYTLDREGVRGPEGHESMVGEIDRALFESARRRD